ncbi:MAG: class B sortase [Butyrivibrio sp.]|nr:class B sortase [Butyrivibrio sp.]
MNKKKIRIALITICAAVIVFEVINIFAEQKDLAGSAKRYETLRNQYAPSGADSSKADTEDAFPEINVDFKGLKGINEDVTAWLYIPCLDISYPVVKENDIDEYLYLSFDKKKSSAGCLFEDVLSDEKFCGRHDMIFGHNMKDGSMFGKLKKVYASGNENLIKDNPYVYVMTEDVVYRYEIFAYETTKVGSEAYSALISDEEYDAYLKYVLANNGWNSEKEYDFADRPSILTLSTCSGMAGGNKRFVIHTYKVGEKILM